MVEIRAAELSSQAREVREPSTRSGRLDRVLEVVVVVRVSG